MEGRTIPHSGRVECHVSLETLSKKVVSGVVEELKQVLPTTVADGIAVATGPAYNSMSFVD